MTGSNRFEESQEDQLTSLNRDSHFQPSLTNWKIGTETVTRISLANRHASGLSPKSRFSFWDPCRSSNTILCRSRACLKRLQVHFDLVISFPPCIPDCFSSGWRWWCPGMSCSCWLQRSTWSPHPQSQAPPLQPPESPSYQIIAGWSWIIDWSVSLLMMNVSPPPFLTVIYFASLWEVLAASCAWSAGDTHYYCPQAW